MLKEELHPDSDVITHELSLRGLEPLNEDIRDQVVALRPTAHPAAFRPGRFPPRPRYAQVVQAPWPWSLPVLIRPSIVWRDC